MTVILKTEGLTRRFRSGDIETTALDGIDIEIERGDFVSVMGPSGCGKSTLLHVLGLIDQPDGGRYTFLDDDVSRCSESDKARLRRQHLGFVFQNFNLIDELPVYRNVELPLLYNRVGAAERRRRVEAVLERMDMGHRAEHYPQQLSGGQQQRVAVARAIVNQPDLILADEPTGNLDSENSAGVIRALEELNAEGITIVMVTHSGDDASHGRRVINMLDGRVAD
ncbi:MAG: ABC transporter ATP-binding protein [Pseudomonadota bacterium]